VECVSWVPAHARPDRDEGVRGGASLRARWSASAARHTPDGILSIIGINYRHSQNLPLIGIAVVCARSASPCSRSYPPSSDLFLAIHSHSIAEIVAAERYRLFHRVEELIEMVSPAVCAGSEATIDQQSLQHVMRRLLFFFLSLAPTERKHL
jgi:hypothetical protein